MKKLATILIVTLLMMSSFAQKQVLELRLDKGKTYQQIFDMPMQIKYDFESQSIEMDMNMKMSLSYKVIAAEADYYELETTYNLLKIEVNAMGNSVVLSSDNEKETNPVFKFFNEITKYSFIIKTDKRGQTIEIKGYTEMIEKAIQKFPNLSKAEKEQLKQQFSQSFNEETLMQNMTNFGNYFPSTPVGVGDEWDYSYSSNTGAKIKIDGHYKITKITPEFILIDVVAKVNSIESDDYIESNGMMLKLNLNGAMTSTIQLDPKTCWTKTSTCKMIMSGKAEVQENDQLPDGMTMDMSISADINMSDGSDAK